MLTPKKIERRQNITGTVGKRENIGKTASSNENAMAE